VEYCIEKLKEGLMRSACFPHEIGLFLGYPLEDVVGFIENSGQNCICTGCWKVYHNEDEARKLFERYDKCTKVYMRLFAEGKPIERLIVAA
jgi:hypothetical protein